MSANDYLAQLQKQLATRWFDFSEDAVRRYLERQRPDIVRWHPKLTDKDINRQVKDIRERGGALYGELRYGRIFIGHNGAQSYYAARGFRGLLRV